MQRPASAAAAGGGGAKAAALRAAKARASGGTDASDAPVGGSGSGGTEIPGDTDAVRLAAAAAAAGPGGRESSAALEDWGGGRMPGQQTWGESAPDGKLLGACPRMLPLNARIKYGVILATGACSTLPAGMLLLVFRCPT